MQIRRLFMLTVLTAFCTINVCDALTLTKESGDKQTRWENASLTDAMIFRVDVTDNTAPNIVTIVDTARIIQEIQVGTNARYRPTGTLVTLSDAVIHDIRLRLQAGSNTVKLYCRLGVANRYTVDIHEGTGAAGNKLATFTADAIQTAQSVSSYRFDLSASTSSPQIVYDDTLGYYYLRVKVTDANAAPQGFVSVIFTVDGAGQLVTGDRTLANSFHLPTNANGIAEVEYRPGSGTGKVTAHIRYTRRRHTVTYFYRGIRLKLVSGDAQTDYFGVKLRDPLSVRVEDGDGHSASGQPVTFEITVPTPAGGDGEARLFSTNVQNPNYRLTVPTNSSGVAEVILQLTQRPTGLPTSVSHTVVARMAGAPDIVFRATASVPIPEKLELVSGDDQRGNIGATLGAPFKVRVIDTRGNNVANRAVTFVITQGQGSLSQSAPTTGADGIAQTYLRLGNRVEEFTVEARLGNLTPVAFAAQSESAPVRINVVSGNNQAAYKNVRTALPLRVRVTGANRQGVEDVNVEFRVTQGSGSPSDTNVSTDSNGYAETYLTPTSEGAVRVEAHVGGLPAARFTISVSIAPARLVKISGDEQRGELNHRLARPFVVEVRGSDGEPVSGTVVRFKVDAGGGTLSNATQRSNAKGRAQTYLTLGNMKIENRVVADIAGISEQIVFIAQSITQVHVAPNLRPPLYWLDASGLIYRLVGTEIEQFGAAARNVTCFAIAEGRLYWGEQLGKHSGRLRSAALDGTGVQELKTLTSVPRGMAVDSINGKLYWTNSWGKIQRLNTKDGKKFQNLITQLRTPIHIAVDVKGRKFYWSEVGRIRRADFNGSNQQVVANVSNPVGGIAVSGDKIYWTEKTEETRGDIKRANLNGSDIEMLISIASVPLGLTVEPATRQLYWTNSRGRIQRSSINGSFIQNLVGGLGALSTIAISPRGESPSRPPQSYADSDVNRDGKIDIADLRLVADAIGQTPPSNRRTDVDGNGTVDIADLIHVITNLPTAAAPEVGSTVSQTMLLPNYPNPFNPETWIPYQLADAAEVKINIYSGHGVLIRTLSLGYQSRGYYLARERAAHWDGRNQIGEPVASGIYFYELVTDVEALSIRKMLIVR